MLYYSHMTFALSSALSGLNAASQRANAAASNIANAGVTGARPGTEGPAPYTPLDVVQTSNGHGTEASTVKRDPATVTQYQPDAHYADKQGYVAAPNVDDAREIVDLKQAANAYKANAAVIRTQNDMQKELFASFDETV